MIDWLSSLHKLLENDLVYIPSPFYICIRRFCFLFPIVLVLQLIQQSSPTFT